MPTTLSLEMLEAIPLAKRLPLTDRLGRRMIHNDHDSPVGYLQFSRDGSRLVGSSHRENIQTWDTKTCKQLQLITSDDSSRGSFWELNDDFSRLYMYVDGSFNTERVKKDGRDALKAIYSGSSLQTWNPETGEVIEILKQEERQFIALSISPNKTHLLMVESLGGTFFDLLGSGQRILDLGTGKWQDVAGDVGANGVFNNSGTQYASFVEDSTKRYVEAVSIRQFPSMKEIGRFELPKGIHGEGDLHFSSDDNRLLIGYRTYPKKNQWAKWQTALVCHDIKSGITLGRYEYPFKNDSFQLGQKQLHDGTIVFSTWRTNPYRLYGLSYPELKPKWECELGDYRRILDPVVSPAGKHIAVVCKPNSDALDIPRSAKVDWNLVPQDELMLFGDDGNLLSTMVVPEGTNSLIYDKGDKAVIGAVGSVYEIDLTGPFE